MPLETLPLPQLRSAVVTLGKPAWRPLLAYVAGLHARSIRPALAPLPHPWEEIGPGYCYGPAFGHWDIAHQLADSLVDEPEHVARQIENILAVQEPDGLIGGSCYLREGALRWLRHEAHPPMWAILADELFAAHDLPELRTRCLEALVRQIAWFERERGAEPFGFCYTDIVTGSYESGIDCGIRFQDVEYGRFPCIDACAHVHALYDCAARWSREDGGDGEAERWIERRDALTAQIRHELFSEYSGFFHDFWLREPERQRGVFEGMWPVVFGIATPEQARRVIHEHLLEPRRFRSVHPIASVAADEPRRRPRMWQGPAWNSTTWWAARGCLRYGEPAAACELLERALDRSAAVFADTGTIWEFYDADGGDPRRLGRKSDTEHDAPCPDYLGHNPLIAMARLWASVQDAAAPEA